MDDKRQAGAKLPAHSHGGQELTLILKAHTHVPLRYIPKETFMNRMKKERINQ